MKTNNILRLFSTMAIIVTMLSCSGDQEFIQPTDPIKEIPADESYPITISAGIDPGTRAYMTPGGGDYYWTQNDQVGLMVTTANSSSTIISNLPMTGDHTEQTLHTTFTGQLSSAQLTYLDPNGTFDYYSYFPYDAANSGNSLTVGFTIPSSITLTPNVFNTNYAPMVGTPVKGEGPIVYLDGNQDKVLNGTTDPVVHFDYKHVLSYAMIEMDCRLMEEPVRSITITKSSSTPTPFVGTMNIDLTTGAPTWSGSSNTLTVLIPAGLNVGEDVLYLPMPPVDMSGDTFTFEFNTGSTDHVYVAKNVSGIRFERGKIHRLRIAPQAVYTANSNFSLTISGHYFIEAWGGDGGYGGYGQGNNTRRAAGGKSQRVAALYTLTAGTTLNVYLGSAGNDGGTGSGNSILNATEGGRNDMPTDGVGDGRGGYGAGGGAGSSNNFAGDGGGGGAATFILINNNPSSPLLVSGGGGGGGGTANPLTGTGNRDGGKGGDGGLINSNGNNGDPGGGGGGGTAGENQVQGTAGGGIWYKWYSGIDGNNFGVWAGANASFLSGAAGGGGGGGGGGYAASGYGGGYGAGGGNNKEGGGGGVGGSSYASDTNRIDANGDGDDPHISSRANGTNGYVVITFLR